jgi:hypothetical protein
MAQQLLRPLFAICTLFTASCSTQAWYQGANTGQQIHCMQEPESAYQECIKGTDTRYDEYMHQQEEARKVKF